MKSAQVIRALALLDLLAAGYRLRAIRRAFARHATTLRTLYPHIFY